MRVVQDLQGHLFGVSCDLMQLRVGCLRHLAQDLGPRVICPVDAVAEAWKAGVLGVSIAKPGVGVLDRPDRVQHRARRVGRAAVRGAFQGSDGTDHARGQVAACRRDDAGGEGRGVEAVVGQQDEIRVEPVDPLGRRLLAVHHPEQVGGVTKLVAWLDHVSPLTPPVRAGDDGRHHRRQGDSFGD